MAAKVFSPTKVGHLPFRRMEIEPMTNKGSFTVTHVPHDSGSGPMPKEKKYAFSTAGDMLDHVTKHTSGFKSPSFKEAVKAKLDSADSLSPSENTDESDV